MWDSPTTETHIRLDGKEAYLAVEGKGHTSAHLTRLYLPSLPDTLRMTGQQSKIIGYANSILEGKLQPAVI